MKVLMTVDTVGGVWTYSIELARALAAHDVFVIMASMGAPLTSSQRAQVEALSNVTIAESAYRLEWMEEPWADVASAGDWLLELDARETPDVVHVNGYAHGALPFSAPVCVVAHSCVLSWWRAVHGEAAPLSWNPYRSAVRAGLESADIVIAPSAAMLAVLDEYEARLARTRVIHNGRSIDRFLTMKKEPFVLTVGRLWDEAKNAAAMGRIAGTIPWPVYIAGETIGPYGDQSGFARARYLGRLDESELAAWMGRASVYALPARYEPFGLSALEAALAGCALVLGDIASLREIWGDTALYVSPDDDAELQHAIGRLMTHDTLRTHMASRARARARRYAPGRMAAAYYDVYRNLLAEDTLHRHIGKGACVL